MPGTTTNGSGLRARVTGLLAKALGLYTRYVPFHRGRGVLLRIIERLKRRGWPAPLVPIGDGLVMELEPSLLGWTLFERGEWEPEQTSTVLSLLESAQVVVNVGANTGYYTLIAARRIGPGGHVHAFEIQPAITAILRRNIDRNGLNDVVTVVEKGCFSADGEAVIEPHGDPGSARIAFGEDGLHVSLVTLDHYARSVALERLDVLIIDAEGADFEILKGASAVLERFRPTVLAEVHHLQAFGGSEEELRRFMAQFGYVARELRGEYSRDLLFTRAS
jgi:FkbM family methyltransferase